MTTLEHPHLVAANFNLFPRLIATLQGQRFCNATEIIKNATEELKRLSQNQEYFQHLYSRKQSCIVAGGDCFERSVA
jgi:hypothetical protein